jgi:hydrogenase 3 maturation protease
MDQRNPQPPPNLKLTEQLRPVRDLALLAVGSELFGDDAVALRVAELLQPHVDAGKPLHTFIGSNAPENCTGPIRRLNPSHLVVVDAADLGQEAGTISLIERDQLAGVSFCTHSLPLFVIIDYILKACPNCKVLIVGIQPLSLRFGEPLSPKVEHAAQVICASFLKALDN